MMKTKKYFVPAILALLLAAFLVIAPVAAADSVSNAADWQKYVVDKASEHQDIDVVLTNDIVLGITAGSESSYLTNVKIDGNGHTITLNLADNQVDNVGLLGYVKDGKVSITNLTLKGKIVMQEKAGKNRAAALIGYANGGTYTLDKVNLAGMDVSYGGTVGGLIGYADNGATISMTDCSITLSTIATTSGYFVGGFTGWLKEGTTVSFKNCSMTSSYISGSKVPAGGFIGCLAGSALISDCTITKSEIYSAFGQNGGLVGYLEGKLVVENTKITESTVISTGVPAKNQGASTRAVVTDKNVGVGGFIGEISTETDKDGIAKASLSVTGSEISNSYIYSNRGDMLHEVVGNPETTVPGVTLTDNVVMEISKETNPLLYEGKAEPTSVSTPLPLLGILAGLGVAGLIARKRKSE